jgi:transcription initiation factor TFIID subunit 1
MYNYLLILTCINRHKFEQETKWYLKEIPSLFVIGQTYPVQEVPGPHARKITTTVKNRLQVRINE